MNRREFLTRMLAAGLVAAPVTKFIFDYGANSYKDDLFEWRWVQPENYNDPFRRMGFYYTEIEFDGVNLALKTEPEVLGVLVERPPLPKTKRDFIENFKHLFIDGLEKTQITV